MATPKAVPAGEFDPATGQLVSTQKSALKRSWIRGAKAPGTFDAKFDFEGATIYINSLTDPDFEAIEGVEKENKERADRLEAMQLELNNPDLSPEDRAALVDKVTAENKAVTRMGETFFLTIIEKTVVGWENAPIDYSPVALQHLPLEIAVNWAKTILEKSRLGATEADFLPRIG